MKHKIVLIVYDSLIFRFIRNPVYCSKIFIPKYKGEESRFVKGLREPLVAEVLFYAMQNVLDGRKRNYRLKAASLPPYHCVASCYAQNASGCLPAVPPKGTRNIIPTTTVRMDAAHVSLRKMSTGYLSRN